ncbi:MULTISPECIES: aldehyde dehydrogenase family protein [Hydrocarboniphaga]|jgi:phenylacetaldehyde dehydrogenase|uniref:Aldehyde dehydrogenase n=1 Tax=Hydrocarboniphaga effusa AP103 TaxID=1172194 RepID=I8T743_9GAMM|nr:MULTISPECIES: aldehyde dehydrogenase family protein [Hydrocarboniphaga]EIT69770.1 aldehyde dehydrogenase [Hydrocarboniphaga effusa AP103]MDZ4078848.1 aldehyde dehydrogenase family protein [Hydrocarboniphaga sp.]
MTNTPNTALLGSGARAFIDRRNHPMLIGGAWVDAIDGARFDVIDPADESVIASVPSAGRADVERAVQAATLAFEHGAWPNLRPAERQRLLLKLADLIERDAQVLAEIESVDNGKSAVVARAVDIALTVDFFRYMAGWATKIEGSTVDVSVPYAPGSEFFAYTRREPVGVVAAVVPWNFPLLVATWKLAPALAAGCTVVLKPAEQTPLSAIYLGRLIIEAGFPPGVVNIITGDGPNAGAPLVSHPGIHKISFTGSTEVGKLIGRAAMDNMTRVTLELGGKSPMIVLDDCDADLAAQGAANAIFFNHGQVCCAGSRLYVPKRLYDRVVDGLASHAAALPMGSGLEAQTQLGPLVSQEQLDRVCHYIELGRQQGARMLTGGARSERTGYFVQPTVFASDDESLRIVREEIFGPVVVALPYDDLDEVARRANDTPFGLGASIWSSDLSRVQRLVPKLKAGTVWVNCHSMLDPAVPFGGYKLSGFGRDMGRVSLDAYLETKSVFMKI